MKMKRMLLLPLLLMCTVQLPAEERYMEKAGSVVYSLPSTTLGLKVCAESESFTAGPYAKYAYKYLGVEAETSDRVSYRLLSVELTPYVEADRHSRYVVSLSGAESAMRFMKMTAQGLVSVSDGVGSDRDVWRFSGMAGTEAFSGEVGSNLSEETTTLYKTVRTEDGTLEKVPVRQSQVVEKSLEKKARETADMIFNLRQKKIDIITGDTDATFDGEALGAAVAEINRLEQRYIELFLGRSVKDRQEMRFDVIPEQGMERQMTIAFRFSEDAGILPVSDVAGRPVVVEITQSEGDAVDNESAYGRVTGLKGFVNYRIPAVADVRVLDGGMVLIDTRVPIYQLGRVVTLPIK